MPVRPIILKLPDDLRTVFENMIRAAAYGDVEKLALWLTEKGHAISKSAVWQYAARLRQFDIQQRRKSAMLLGTIRAHRRKPLTERKPAIQLDKAQTFKEIEALQKRLAALCSHLRSLP